MGIKFIYIILYRRPVDTRELWSSNSFTSAHISGPPIPGNYGHQFHLHHLVLAARRYQGNSETSCWSLIFYRRIACLCQRIRSSLACFVVLYRRIDPSYRRAVSEPPFTPLCRHSPLREQNTAPLRARTNAIVPAPIFQSVSVLQCRSQTHSEGFSLCVCAMSWVSLLRKTYVSLLRSQHVNQRSAPSLSSTSLDPD